MEIPFIKMNGAGNDFVVLDARRESIVFSPDQVRQIAARDNLVTKGCDQLVVIESVAAEEEKKAEKIPQKIPAAFMRLYNSDGSITDACGNATRCVAWKLMQEAKTDNAIIHTNAGKLLCKRAGNLQVTVDMGKPRLSWQEIPLAKQCDVLSLPIAGSPAAVSMGNPHMVFAVDNLAEINIEKLGAELEYHPLYPNRANVSFAQIIGSNNDSDNDSNNGAHKILLRVWERGAGATLACGTAACATLVALSLRGLIGRKAEVELPGGILAIEWLENDHVLMTGGVAEEFSGYIVI